MKFLLNRSVYIIALVQAALALGAAFGLDLTGAQVSAIVAFFSAVLAVVAGTVVSSPETVAAVATDAATRTAAKLVDTTVGEVGEITAAGEGVVTGAVGEALDNAGGLVGALVKGDK